MFFLNLLIALAAPYLTGLLMEGYRNNRVFRSLMQLPGRSRSETAVMVREVIEEDMKKELTLGGAMALSSIFLSLTLASHPVGFIVAGVVTPGLFAGLMFRDYRRKIKGATRRAAMRALDEYMENRPVESTEGMMEGISGVEDEKLQLSVVNRIMNWGSRWALLQLRESQSRSPFVEVRHRARAGADSVRELLDSINHRRLGDLTSLVSRAGFWRRLGKTNHNRSERLLLLSGAETPEKNEDPLFHAFEFQHELMAAYPHIFCLADGTRTELVSEGGWKHIRCVTCKEANDLVPGVHRVVGHIGPQVDPILQPDGVLPVNLWNPNGDKSKAVAMDELVIAAGSDFNYDWAVSASLEAFRNRFPDYDRKIRVELDPRISLSTNTLNLLKSIAQDNYLHEPSIAPAT